MAGEGTPAVFEDEEFWYRVDVDYEEAVESVESEDEENESDQNGGPETVEEALLDSFVKRKRSVILARFDSVEAFREQVKTDDSARSILNEIYVQYLWTQSQDGEKFDSEEDGLDAIDAVADDERLVQESVNEEFDLLWPGEATIGKEVEDGDLVARRYYQTKPVVIRKSNGSFEVRGRTRNRKKVVSSFREDDDLEEQEPEPAEEPIVGKVESLLIEDNDQFRVIGVVFAESELPQSSRLRIKNERPIYQDIETLWDQNIVSFDGISEVNKLYLKDTQTGGKFRIELKHGVEGVEFDLKANHKLDEERKRFKRGFTDVTGIEFGKIYEYGSEDEEYLFNRILAGRGTAYDNYYEELSDEIRAVLEGDADASGNALIRTRTEEVKQCRQCAEKIQASASECEDCGSADFSEPSEETVVEVNETSVATYIENRIEEVEPEHPKRDISNWTVKSRTMSDRKIVDTSFSLTDAEGRRTTSSYQEVDVVPHGNHRRPRIVNDYLLQCVYVTYGESAAADDEGYGRLSLYEIITSDDLGESVGTALHNAILGVKVRLRMKSSDAREDAREYLRRVDEFGEMHEHKDELAEIYDPKNDSYFEKHLFYLLKRVYPQSERWGRVGEREADGVLIAPEEDPSHYYVATYDAKLSHREDGYDLSSEEEDQATRYVLTEEEREAIENKTGDSGLSGHLLISQNFDESDFPRIAGNFQDNISTYTGEGGPSLVFMEFRALVELYDLQEEYWWALRDSRIRAKFDSYVIDELNNEQTEDGSTFVHFDTESVESIREHLIARIDDYDHEQLEYYPE